MEKTGGEPDVDGHDKKTGDYIFMIVQQKVRKAEALESRKEQLEQAVATGLGMITAQNARNWFRHCRHAL